LLFWTKGQSTDSNSALLVEGYSGGGWNALTNLVPLLNTATNRSLPLSSDITRLRFTYTKSAGNLAFDDVIVQGLFCGPSGETPPILNPIGDTSVEVSNTLQFAVTAQPTDGDPVTLSVSNAPAGAEFVSTNENGTFYFTPTFGQIGVHTTTFYAADNDGVTSETIRITVTPPSLSAA